MFPLHVTTSFIYYLTLYLPTNLLFNLTRICFISPSLPLLHGIQFEIASTGFLLPFPSHVYATQNHTRAKRMNTRRIPSTASNGTACISTENKNKQQKPQRYLLPEPLRDALVLLTVSVNNITDRETTTSESAASAGAAADGSVDGNFHTSYSVLVNLAEAESLRRSLWRLDRLCKSSPDGDDETNTSLTRSRNEINSLEVCLWLLPESSESLDSIDAAELASQEGGSNVCTVGSSVTPPELPGYDTDGAYGTPVSTQKKSMNCSMYLLARTKIPLGSSSQLPHPHSLPVTAAAKKTSLPSNLRNTTENLFSETLVFSRLYSGNVHYSAKELFVILEEERFQILTNHQRAQLFKTLTSSRPRDVVSIRYRLY